tara:strand:- start:3735 stop:4376 length:642 start_codon:yes stop_codon:yes gene_type:complete
MAFKRKGFPKHATVSHLKEYIPQSQRKMDQYTPQTEMDWNDPNRPEFRVSSKDYEENTTETTSPGELLNNPDSVVNQPNVQPFVETEDFPSASSNRPKTTTTSTPTEIDTSDIDARWARKNARREYRQAARRDRQAERQGRRQSRRDARQKRKMDRIENRTERQEARRARRAARKADRGRGSKFYTDFGSGEVYKERRKGPDRKAKRFLGGYI